MNMKKDLLKKMMKSKVMVFMSLFLFTAVMLSGCGESDVKDRQDTDRAADVSQESKISDENAAASTDGQDKSADDTEKKDPKAEAEEFLKNAKRLLNEKR